MFYEILSFLWGTMQTHWFGGAGQSTTHTVFSFDVFLNFSLSLNPPPLLCFVFIYLLLFSNENLQEERICCFLMLAASSTSFHLWRFSVCLSESRTISEAFPLTAVIQTDTHKHKKVIPTTSILSGECVQ